MIDVMIMRGIQSFEYIKMNGLSSFFRETIYHDRRAIIVEKDLAEVKERAELLKQFDAKIIEIDEKAIREKKYFFKFKNRHLKALHYLEKGYGGYVMVRGREIIGDIWYYAHDLSAALHPDLPWLGVGLAKDEVYSFDIFFVPHERGNNLSAALQNNVTYALGKKGYTKAYAYLWADNTPAIWNTRVLNRWKEVRTARMKRFLINKTVEQ